jgi:hypothetical protein
MENSMKELELKTFLELHNLITKGAQIDSVGGLNVW